MPEQISGRRFSGIAGLNMSTIPTIFTSYQDAPEQEPYKAPVRRFKPSAERERWNGKLNSEPLHDLGG